MAFREYKIGTRMFGIALGGSMMITLYMPSLTIYSVGVTETGLVKGLSYGHNSGFSYADPFLKGKGKPLTVTIKKDPVSGADIDPVSVYVYAAGTPFPSAIRNPNILGAAVQALSAEDGRVGDAVESEGAVFLVSRGDYEGETFSYIENVSATRNWSAESVLTAAADSDKHHVGSGKTMFVREGCWWCHTLLPEQTQDWQYFGLPPRLGDFNGEAPTAFGSDRKGPDLLHVGSRNSSKEWMMMHFFNPRLVQPHSIMPRFDYLWGKVDVDGNDIDYDQWRADYNDYVDGESFYPPIVPDYAPNSEIRYLVDFILSLK